MPSYQSQATTTTRFATGLAAAATTAATRLRWPQWRLLALAVVCVASLATTSLAGSLPCTATDPETNDVYDLSPLIRTSGDDWIASDQTEKNMYIYRLNVCHDLLYKPPKELNFTIPLNTGAHQLKVNTTRQHVIGQTASPKIISGILLIEYLNGEMCDRTQESRTVILSFACDPDGKIGNPVFLFENDCDYFFEWKTSAACPVKPKSLSGFAIFAIIMAVLTTLYFTLGFLYNRFIAGKQGAHQIPNYAFWAGLVGSLKCWGDQKVVRYSRVPGTVGTADDELNPDEFDDDAIENDDTDEIFSKGNNGNSHV